MATTTARPAVLDPQQHGAHKASLTVDDRRELLRYMLLMRATEERALTLYRQGKVPGSYYDGRGQEAVSVGSAFALGPRDRACILHRDLGAHLIRGVTPGRVLAQMMGRAGGVTGGRDGNMHFGDRELGCVGMVSMLPDMALVACGLALAFQMRREPRVAMTWFGDGSTANGQWHEAMNVAGVRRLPVVFILENNQFAYSTPNELEFAVDPVRARRDLRVPGREGGRQRRRGGVRRGGRGVRPRARGRRPDADRGRDDAHARPRRPRRHALRAARAAREVGARATRSRTTRSGCARTASTPRRSARRWPRSSTARPSGRSPSRCPTPRAPPRACSPPRTRCSATGTRRGRAGGRRGECLS